MEQTQTALSAVVLGYVLSRDRSSVLMIYHNGDPQDNSYGKYNGLSGRLEDGESVSDAMRRVVASETGLTPSSMSLRGVIHWTNFGHRHESLLGHVFLIPALSGAVPPLSHKGEFHWIPIERLLSPGELPMWSGDENILPLVFDHHKDPFFGHMPYDMGVPRAWSFDRPGRGWL